MQDPIIEKIFEATQAAQEAEAQKDCDLTETQDVTGLGVITSRTPAQPTPITMPTFWFLTSGGGRFDPAIPTGLKINTDRVRIGDVCRINITCDAGQMTFNNAVICYVDENAIKFNITDIMTMDKSTLEITTAQLVDPTRHIMISGAMPGQQPAPFLNPTYWGGNPFCVPPVPGAPRPI